MNLTIELAALKALTNKLTGAVEKKNTIPALANVAIYAGDGILTGKTTDLDIEVTATTPAEVTAQGATTVNAAMFAALVAKLPSGSLVTLAMDDYRLIVKAGRSRYELQTLPIEDFPQMASSEYSHQFNIAAHELSRLFNLSKGAMSTEETRYYLQGVYLHPTDDNDICAVATDGHRLNKIKSKMHVDFPGVIVPSKTVGQLVKMIDIGDVLVSVSDTKIRFDMGATVLVSKVIDGTFPDYRRVIPTGNDRKFVADASKIKAASDRVATIANDRYRGVKIEVENGIATLSTQADIGSATDQVEVSQIGDKITFTVNAKFIAEALAQCSGSEVTLSTGDTGMEPIIIQPNDDENALYIVMPLRG